MKAAWFVIARREFLERVRTKWFIISTLLGPIGMVALIVIPAVLARVGDKEVRVKVVDHSGRVAPLVVPALQKARWHVEEVPATTPPATLDAEIRRDQIDGYIVIPRDAVDAGETVYFGDNATNQGVAIAIDRTIRDAVQKLRAGDIGISQDKLAQVLKDVNVRSTHWTGEGEKSSGAAAFLVGYIVMFILYMAIVLYAINVMRSVVQEKTSRVVELMVAAAKPRALMAGKILGVGAVGLCQLIVWLGMAWFSVEYRDSVLGVFGVSGAGGFQVPALRPQEIAIALTYFLLGYYFYAALYAAIGAMVSSEQEAQQAQTPVVLLLIIPMACMSLVANDPRGTTAEVLTMVPFSSPVLMPMRFLLGGASALQVALSIAILTASTAVVAAMAARIYRVGILMYGKRPSLRELVRWLRY